MVFYLVIMLSECPMQRVFQNLRDAMISWSSVGNSIERQNIDPDYSELARVSKLVDFSARSSRLFQQTQRQKRSQEDQQTSRQPSRKSDVVGQSASVTDRDEVTASLTS